MICVFVDNSCRHFCRHFLSGFRTNDDQFSIPERDQCVGVSVDQEDALNGQMQGQGVKLLQGEQISEYEITVLISCHEVAILNNLNRNINI